MNNGGNLELKHILVLDESIDPKEVYYGLDPANPNEMAIVCNPSEKDRVEEAIKKGEYRVYIRKGTFMRDRYNLGKKTKMIVCNICESRPPDYGKVHPNGFLGKAMKLRGTIKVCRRCHQEAQDRYIGEVRPDKYY